MATSTYTEEKGHTEHVASQRSAALQRSGFTPRVSLKHRGNGEEAEAVRKEWIFTKEGCVFYNVSHVREEPKCATLGKQHPKKTIMRYS